MLKEPTKIDIGDEKIKPKIQEVMDLTPDKRSGLLSYCISSSLRKPRHYLSSGKPQWVEENSEGDRLSDIIEKDEPTAQAVTNEIIKLYWNDRQKNLK